jgi:hypothetical protein
MYSMKRNNVFFNSGGVQYWDIMAVHDGARYNSSERCLDRRGLAEKFARRQPSDSASVSVTKKQDSKSQNSTGQKPWMEVSPYTGELAATQQPKKKSAPPRPMDMDIDRRTHISLSASCPAPHCTVRYIRL